MKNEAQSIDARVRHAGKAGKHQARVLNVRKGRTRKRKRQESKSNRWSTE